jgi:hypothetical protein
MQMHFSRGSYFPDRSEISILWLKFPWSYPTCSYGLQGERTCPDTPNRKYPDKIAQQEISRQQKSKQKLSGYFPLVNRKYPDRVAVSIWMVYRSRVAVVNTFCSSLRDNAYGARNKIENMGYYWKYFLLLSPWQLWVRTPTLATHALHGIALHISAMWAQHATEWGTNLKWILAV